MKFIVSLSRVLVFLFGFSVSSPLYAQGTNQEVGVEIKPSVYQFSALPGETQVRTVRLTNGQSTPIQMRFFLGDWVRDSLGKHIYYKPGTLASSCARWITLSQEFVEVPPNGSASLDITLTMPDSPAAAEAFKWAMLFAEPVQETQAPAPTNARISAVIEKKQRHGLHIYQQPPNLTKKELKVLGLQRIANYANTYRIVCENTGELQLQCKPYLDLTELTESGATSRVNGMTLPVFPGQRRVFDLAIPATQHKGKYNVIAAVDAGEDVELEAVQAEINVE